MDLADKEKAEIEVLQVYLPKAMSQAEVEELIAAAITNIGATSMRDMGKVMAEVKPKVQGRFDLGQVSALVKNKLHP